MKTKSIFSVVSFSVACLSLAAVSRTAYAICAGSAECVSVPEPSIFGLMGVGVAALAVVGLIRRKRK